MFTEWLFQKTLDKAVSRIELLFLDTYQNEIDAIVEKWARSLPPDKTCESMVFFPPVLSEEERHQPRQEALSKLILERTIPSAQIIWEALKERWMDVNQLLFPQPFFTIPEEEAHEDLKELSIRLHNYFILNDKFFRTTLYKDLVEIKEVIQSNSEILQEQIEQSGLQQKLLEELHAAIKQLVVSKSQKPAVKWRDILIAKIPYSYDPELLVMNVKFFRYCMFKAFGDSGYIKFTGLICPDPGYLTIITGQSQFIAIMIETADFMRYHKDYPSDWEDEELEKFSFSYDIDRRNYIPHEFIFDGQQRLMTIKPVSIQYTPEIYFRHPNTFSDALISMSNIIAFGYSLIMVDFDRLKNAPAMLKFIDHLIANKSIDFNKIIIDMDDPEHWDYPLFIGE